MGDRRRTAGVEQSARVPVPSDDSRRHLRGRVTVRDKQRLDTPHDKQQKMIDFEKHWYQLGGGSSSAIAEQFGLTDREFFDEVDRIVADDPPATLTSGELRRMRGVIRRRRWMAR